MEDVRNASVPSIPFYPYSEILWLERKWQHLLR
jgi:hypothetical protein